MKILSIDSSTQSASCAILDDDKLLGEITFNYKKHHSIILMPMIDALLKNTGLSINDIDGFACSNGPGSFTGLRIGMATAKGLSQANNKHYIGVSTLDALANNLAYTSGIICPIIDALRNNVYTALYSFNKDKLVKHSDYKIINIDDLIEILSHKDETITFIGDALNKFKSKLCNSLDNVYTAPIHLNIASASSIGQLGMQRLKQNIYDDIFTCGPIYIQKSQAEREYEKRCLKNE